VKSANRIVRLHFLSTLLSEAAEYLHLILTASAFNLPFLEVPFTREVDLKSLDIQQLGYVFQMIQDFGGCVLMAPEHRLSLGLKMKELLYEGKALLASELLSFLKQWRFLDIFDESDDILSHKYHLMYALGNPIVMENVLMREIYRLV
jgi:hypothetical protein